MKKTLALVPAMILLSGCLNGCKEGGDREMSELLPDSAITSATQSTENSAVSSDTGISESSVVSRDTGISEYIDGLDNDGFVFVDYSFNENLAAITDKNALGDAYDRAFSALKATEDYKKFTESFSKNSPQTFFSRPVEDFFAAGSPEAIFKGAIKDDFDRDGAEESFILFTIAKENGDRWGERDYLVFVGNSGAEVICDYYGAKFTAVLDYGSCKQIIVGSEGWNGNDRLSNIWGVRGGKAAKLYGGRLDYEKVDCFLYSSGPQYIGDFAVYDTQKGEYLAIQGKELTAEQIKSMDSDGVLQKDIVSAVLIGGKYYIINMNGVYTYESGRFASSDKKVRSSDTPGVTGEALNTLSDIDYDAALASMKTPEEARELI